MKLVKQSISILLLSAIVMLSGCATILGGKRTTYQTTKPRDGQPQRQPRVGYIIASGLLTGGIGLIVDFATGAIYKPAPDTTTAKK